MHFARYRINNMALSTSPCIMPTKVSEVLPVFSPIFTRICGLFVKVLIKCISSSSRISSSSSNDIFRFTVSKAFDISNNNRYIVKSFDMIAFSASNLMVNTCSVVPLPG